MVIITNTINTGEYTPTKVKTMEEAMERLLKCTVNNIRVWKGDIVIDSDKGWEQGVTLAELDDKRVIEWAKENLLGFEFSEDGKHSLIVYEDDSFNNMNIYDIDKLPG